MAEVRLQKLISTAGLASRRDAELYIQEGRIRVNGKVVTELGSKADPAKDEIMIDDRVVTFDDEPKLILMMHKPPKVIVTTSDPQGRPTVFDVLAASPAFQRRGPRQVPRVYPVGRLDYDAEGLLILTNDGDLADLLTHPRNHVPKTYLVKVSGVVDERGLRRIGQGMHLKEADGRVVKTQPAVVELHRKTETNCWYSVTVFEGRNRLLKRLFSAVGHPVRRILRIDFGGLKLGELPQGQWRALDAAEELKLRKWTKLDSPEEFKRKTALRPRKGPGAARKGPDKRGHGRGKTTQAQGRSGEVPRQRAR